MNYIGSKLSILNYIDDTIQDFADFSNDDVTFCDIFAGTSSVGKYFKNKGYNVISNDIEYYSFVNAKHFIENNEKITFDKLKKDGIQDVFEYLNNLNDKKGFIYKNYTISGTKNQEYERKYFTEENAIKIDSIRDKIEEWKNNGLIEDNEYYYLITCLLEASDKVANTASVYEAFLKNIKKSASKTMEIKPLEILTNDKNKKYLVTNKDANLLINEISGDILYMDPPYNTRKYDTNYHILETIALYDNPKIKGKTGVREETKKRSKYCVKKEVESTFEDLIKKAKFKYIFLSYNDEGIIPLNRIKEIMSKYGEYKVYEKNHKRFKADSKREYLKDSTIEYIHCLKKY
jgi:hypothetical protein